MTLYTNSLKYLIIFYSLLLVFCYLILLLFMEILNLKNLKIIVTLGKVAFENCIKIYKRKFDIKEKYIFKHGKAQLLPNNKTILLPSYHPSPRNVNTGLISEEMMVNLFLKAKAIAKL